MNDYEVTITCKMSASSDDNVFYLVEKLFADSFEQFWDVDIDVEQLTFSEPLIDEIE